MDLHPRNSPPSRRGLYNQGEIASQVETDAARVAVLQFEASVGEQEGPGWREIRDDTWAYVLPVLASFIRTGRVWVEYHRLGGRPARDLHHPINGVHSDDAHDLAADTVVGALSLLRHQLVAGKWDPTRDDAASIRTWAVNLCILRVPGPWRLWRRSQLVRLDPAKADRMVDTGDRPDAVIYNVEFERYVARLDSDVAPMVRLDADGLTDHQIAVAVGRSRKSVEYHLRRSRDEAQTRRDHEARIDRIRDGVG